MDGRKLSRDIKEIVAKAQEGEAKSLDALVRHCQDKVHRLAMRMVVDKDLSLDATQEILIQIITKLSTFKGESSFDTWVYRVAMNYLLTARKVLAKDPNLSFELFSADLLSGLVDQSNAAADDHVMLNELRIKCTMAMLMCLNQEQRAAYVLGEILELGHQEASDVLNIEPSQFRKRLSRARAKVVAFTAQSCGLANPTAACSCKRRLPAAQNMGRIGSTPSQVLIDAPDYAFVKKQAEKTSGELIAAKLQRSTGSLMSPKDFANDILSIVDPPR